MVVTYNEAKVTNTIGRCEALNTKQRVLQLRLVAQLCGALSSDMADTAARVLELARPALNQLASEECVAGLGLVSVLFYFCYPLHPHCPGPAAAVPCPAVRGGAAGRAAELPRCAGEAAPRRPRRAQPRGRQPAAAELHSGRVSARYLFLISILILGHFDTYPY